MAETANAKAKRQSITVQGITVKVDVDAMDDQDLLESIEEVQLQQMEVKRLRRAGKDAEADEAEQEANLLATLVNRNVRNALFGDQWEKIKEKLRDKNGKLSATTCREFTDEASQMVRALKN